MSQKIFFRKIRYRGMFCCLSGETPVNPVVSKLGHLYEKQLIIKYLNDNGKCPITNQSMTTEDLIEIKGKLI